MDILKTVNIYLEQSGYEPALNLEKRFSHAHARRFLALLSYVEIFGLALLGVFSIFVKNVRLFWIVLGLWEIILAFLLAAIVYYLFVLHLESGHNFTPTEIKNAWDRQAYGHILNYRAAQTLAVASEGENLLLLPFWHYLLAQENFVWILGRLNISPASFDKLAKEYYPAAAVLPLVNVLQEAWQRVVSANHLYLDDIDLVIAVFSLDEIFRTILFTFEIKGPDLEAAADWRRRMVGKAAGREFWRAERLLDSKGIGKDWTAGYTLTLDRVATDISRHVAREKPRTELYGRQVQAELLERMLLRPSGSGNVVLVGPAGIGRHTLLQVLADRMNRGETFGPLRYRRLLQIDSSAVLSGTVQPNEAIERIERIFGEALLAGNLILVINDFDAFLDSRPEAGRINATEALLPFFQSGLRIIGITTPSGYQSTIGKNQQLQKLFSKLELSEPAAAETLLILEQQAETIERRTGLCFTLPALQEIVKLGERYIQALPNPEKSLELLDETAVYATTRVKSRLIFADHVRKVVSLRTKIPLEKIGREEKNVLLNLESVLHQRIIGQEEAITELADALRRSRSGIQSAKKPIGSFLFLGPTGVGKTETAKALAAVYFGSENRILRFDMSEYQEVHHLNRLIGDLDRNTPGLLTESILANPFSLILLDEIEKAHPKILDLFLQVFDDGRLTDAWGRTISFVNTMIIATSNAGAELVRRRVREGRPPADLKTELLENIQRQGIFRPEFLNRFDAVIMFQPLSEAELTQVAKLLLAELNARLAEKDIQIRITEELAKAVAHGGYSAEFGARPLRRFIQDKLENYLAKGLISGELKRGMEIEVPPEATEDNRSL